MEAARTKTKTENKQAAWILDYQQQSVRQALRFRTGERLQTVAHPLIVVDLMGKPRMTHGKTVLSADWSKDGKALYVFSANGRSVSLWKLIED